MIYQAYQAQADMMGPMRAAAQAALSLLSFPRPCTPASPLLRRLAAGYELVARSGLTHVRPPFGIAAAMVGNREVAVREEVAHATPFCSLLHFAKDIPTTQPRLLVVAPMSGHFTTLLRGTIRTLLADHDVYVTDWHNARDVRLEDGAFTLDDYTAEIITSLEALGPGTHVLAVCQPAVAALAAAAIMTEDDNPARPPSLTLMAGPIDTRINPTKVDELATGHTLAWFEQNLIDAVPGRFAGAGRRVYPGFLQLTGFVSMNPERHIKAHRELFDYASAGETEKAAAIRVFYDEYFAVMDLPAEFFLETIRDIFQEIEGEKDDICSVGQTLAAQELCRSIPPYRKIHHVQTGVGHYGVFNGRRWNTQIYPILRDVVHMND